MSKKQVIIDYSVMSARSIPRQLRRTVWKEHMQTQVRHSAYTRHRGEQQAAALLSNM